MEPKLRLEVSLESQMESKLRLEASLECQVESKLRLESGRTALRVPRRAAGGACWVQLGGCWVQLGGVTFLHSFEALELRDILAEHYVG